MDGVERSYPPGRRTSQSSQGSLTQLTRYAGSAVLAASLACRRCTQPAACCLQEADERAKDVAKAKKLTVPHINAMLDLFDISRGSGEAGKKVPHMAMLQAWPCHPPLDHVLPAWIGAHGVLLTAHRVYISDVCSHAQSGQQVSKGLTGLLALRQAVSPHCTAWDQACTASAGRRVPGLRQDSV